MAGFEITETYDLIRTAEKIKTPSKYLVETFFPEVDQVLSDVVVVEYRKSGRRLAPYVTPLTRGVNVSREGSSVRLYRAPCIGARRVIGQAEISQRSFGETPIYSSMTASDRAAQMQARDLTDLMRMIDNRKNQMCASLLQTGKIVVKGFADAGEEQTSDEITFEWSGLREKDWSSASASVYEDIKAASEEIQSNFGEIPTLMVCGSNVERYLLGNKKLLDYLMIPNRQNLTMVNFEPRYISPQVRLIGQIAALNLDVVVYSETYLDEAGEVKSFIDPNTAVIGVPGVGRQLFGAVHYLDSSGSWQSAAAATVPVYDFNVEAQATSLTVYSRFLPIMDDVSSWVALKVAS